MTGSDETTLPDENFGRSDQDPRRESIARAAPPPVTEAMITPRTVPLDPEEAAELEARVCYDCGELNDPGRSACPVCGARVAAYGATESELPGDDRPGTGEMSAWERPGPDWAPGVDEDPVALWDEEKDGRIGVRYRGASRKRWVRMLLILITAAAILLVGLDYLLNRDEAPEEPEPATTTTTTTTAAETPAAPRNDTLESFSLRAYAEQIAELADDVELLEASGRLINDRWEARIVGFDTTMGALNDLAPQAEEVFLRFREINPPDAADAAAHRRMLEEIANMVTSVKGMMSGLRSTDSGESRREQLALFERAAADFRRLSNRVTALLETGQ